MKVKPLIKGHVQLKMQLKDFQYCQALNINGYDTMKFVNKKLKACHRNITAAGPQF